MYFSTCMLLIIINKKLFILLGRIGASHLYSKKIKESLLYIYNYKIFFQIMKKIVKF